jgi:hypothetical protein
MGRAHGKHEPDQPAADAKAQPVAAPPPPAARLLALQRSAGNAAVAALLARAPVAPPVAPADPRAVAVEPNDPKTADKQTLAEFASFTDRQVDWESQASFLADGPTSSALREVVRLAQADNNAFLGAAGELKMKDLRVVIASQRDQLAAYGRPSARPAGRPPRPSRTRSDGATRPAS